MTSLNHPIEQQNAFPEPGDGDGCGDGDGDGDGDGQDDHRGQKPQSPCPSLTCWYNGDRELERCFRIVS